MQDFLRRQGQRFTRGTRDYTIPDRLWVKCPGCRALIYRKQLEDNYNVCPHCDHHFRQSAHKWIELLLDPHSFREQDASLESTDPLGFVGVNGCYADKLREIQARTGLREALVCGSGTINSQPLEIIISNFEFMGGSMGTVYGEKVASTIERASERRVPLVSINASGGARMHEGIFALMQMAKVSVALMQMAQAQQLHISVLVDPCYGGVSASYASVADITLAEPQAHIGFTGPRVIAQTLRQALSPGFQTAEFLLDHGMIDAIVARSALRRALTDLLRIHCSSPAHLPQPARSQVSPMYIEELQT